MMSKIRRDVCREGLPNVWCAVGNGEMVDKSEGGVHIKRQKRESFSIQDSDHGPIRATRFRIRIFNLVHSASLTNSKNRTWNPDFFRLGSGKDPFILNTTNKFRQPWEEAFLVATLVPERSSSVPSHHHHPTQLTTCLLASEQLPIPCHGAPQWRSREDAVVISSALPKISGRSCTRVSCASDPCAVILSTVILPGYGVTD